MKIRVPTEAKEQIFADNDNQSQKISRVFILKGNMIVDTKRMNGWWEQ